MVFQDRVFLCSPNCPGTWSFDQAGLKLTESHLPVSRVLGLNACTTTAYLGFSFLFLFFLNAKIEKDYLGAGIKGNGATLHPACKCILTKTKTDRQTDVSELLEEHQGGWCAQEPES